MPQIHPPASSHPPPPPTGPFLCEACGKQMQCFRVEPHPQYTNVDRHNYVCHCGRTDEVLVRAE